jgi:hypothetical protein
MKNGLALAAVAAVALTAAVVALARNGTRSTPARRTRSRWRSTVTPTLKFDTPDVPHEPLLLQLGERRPSLFDVLRGSRPVDLVEVDRVDTEVLEARGDLAHDRVALQAVYDAPPLAFEQRGLGEQIRPLAHALQRPSDDLLRVAEAVRGGGVDPVDTDLERPLDGLDRLVVLLRAQPNSQPPPPIAQAPKPTRVISKPVPPRAAVASFVLSMISPPGFPRGSCTGRLTADCGRPDHLERQCESSSHADLPPHSCSHFSRRVRPSPWEPALHAPRHEAPARTAAARSGD